MFIHVLLRNFCVKLYIVINCALFTLIPKVYHFDVKHLLGFERAVNDLMVCNPPPGFFFPVAVDERSHERRTPNQSFLKNIPNNLSGQIG